MIEWNILGYLYHVQIGGVFFCGSPNLFTVLIGFRRISYKFNFVLSVCFGFEWMSCLSWCRKVFTLICVQWMW